MRLKNGSVNTNRAAKFVLDTLNLDTCRPDVSGIALGDWDHFLRLARIHRLGPMLCSRLDHAGLAEPIPESVLDALRPTHRRNALRALKMFRELVNVTEALNEAGIPSIALKGAYLAQFAYPSPALRPLRDLDLLLHREQAVDAFRFLVERGYRPLFHGFPESYLEFGKHLPSLISPDGIEIELHFQLVETGLTCLRPSPDEIWKKSATRKIAGSAVRFLGKEDLLLHLCVHATLQHNLNVGPLALSDVAFLLESHDIDWEDFLNATRAGTWQRCALILLHLAKMHVGAKVPDEVLHRLGETGKETLEHAEHLLFSDPAMHKLEGAAGFFASGTLLERLSGLSGKIFRPRTFIAKIFPARAASPKVFMYYPVYWFRLLRTRVLNILSESYSRRRELDEFALHRNEFDRWLKNLN